MLTRPNLCLIRTWKFLLWLRDFRVTVESALAVNSCSITWEGIKDLDRNFIASFSSSFIPPVSLIFLFSLPSFILGLPCHQPSLHQPYCILWRLLRFEFIVTFSDQSQYITRFNRLHVAPIALWRSASSQPSLSISGNDLTPPAWQFSQPKQSTCRYAKQ